METSDSHPVTRTKYGTRIQNRFVFEDGGIISEVNAKST